jgi:hypothetical protein
MGNQLGKTFFFVSPPLSTVVHPSVVANVELNITPPKADPINTERRRRNDDDKKNAIEFFFCFF